MLPVMDAQWQALLFGLGVIAFGIAIFVSFVKTQPPVNRALEFDYKAVGLFFCFLVALIINVDAM